MASLTAVWVGLSMNPASAAPQEPLFSLVQKEKPAVVNTLRDIVSIESGSQDKAGLDQLSELLAGRLKALGASTEFIDANTERTEMGDTPKEIGRIVVGRFEGTGTRRIMLLAHMDTVYPHGTLAKRPFRIEGDRAYGPGIADDKGGIAVALHTLALLKSLNFRDYKSLTVVFNADEEVSSPGSNKAITRIASDQDVVFSCEPTSVAKDSLGLATSGIALATLTVRGKSSHAGVAPEQGRNALIELSNQLVNSRDLSQTEQGIKFSWTIAKAGTVRNMIPDTAVAEADVRVQKVSDLAVIEKAFKERVQKTPKLVADATVEAKFEPRRPPLEVTERSRVLAKRAQGIYRELGRELAYDESGRGGGTDAAYAALSGKPAVVESFGLAGYGYHSSEEEYILLDSIEPRLYLLARMVMSSAADR